ncbi:hypothetical protein C8Q80DRAFT_1264463 [Daedaleopsis nitida]|nr:hypothetical protein C8Q80DRAFT_1264463 [Daedaleopsis nitida]
MALFLWGFIWFVMSVLVFGLGRFIPAIRPKPPPAASRPRMQSPRMSPKPLPPVPVPSEEQPVAEADAASCESAASDPSRSMTSKTPSAKRPQYKSKWSFSGRLKPRQTSGSSSPRPSFGSAGSSTLVDTPSPSRFMPELPVIESASSSSDPRLGKDEIQPASLSSTGSPRSSRHVRLPSMKMFKSLSRKMSKQKTEVGSSPASSRDNSIDDIIRVLDAKVPLSEEPASDHESAKEAPPDHRPVLPRNNSSSGEVFTSTFVNPFRPKNRKTKTPPPPLSPIQRSPTSRRHLVPRRMLTSIHIASVTVEGHTAVPDSPRSSVSSSSSFSSLSVVSPFPSSTSSSPCGPLRTQPYGPPYYAAMPIQRPPARRATSLSLERPETVVEESGDGDDDEGANNALGLELGQRQQSRAAGLAKVQAQVQSEPRRRRLMHRTTASESAAQAVETR